MTRQFYESEACRQCVDLEQENDGLREENMQLRKELAKATKAGTPYWHERDAMNGLIFEIDRLHNEIAQERVYSAGLLAELEAVD